MPVRFFPTFSVAELPALSLKPAPRLCWYQVLSPTQLKEHHDTSNNPIIWSTGFRSQGSSLPPCGYHGHLAPSLVAASRSLASFAAPLTKIRKVSAVGSRPSSIILAKHSPWVTWYPPCILHVFSFVFWEPIVETFWSGGNTRMYSSFQTLAAGLLFRDHIGGSIKSHSFGLQVVYGIGVADVDWDIDWCHYAVIHPRLPRGGINQKPFIWLTGGIWHWCGWCRLRYRLMPLCRDSPEITPEFGGVEKKNEVWVGQWNHEGIKGFPTTPTTWAERMIRVFRLFTQTSL